MERMQNLIESARQAAKNAYAPYSGFKVGAALLTETNEIFTGCNVENASYGLTMCAERTSLFKAVSAGERRFSEMVIYTDTEQPFYPCGACRQVLSEFCPELEITIIWKTGQERLNLGVLLPNQFKL